MKSIKEQIDQIRNNPTELQQNYHVLWTVKHLRSMGVLLSILLNRFTAQEVVQSLGVMHLADSFGVTEDGTHYCKE